MTYRFASYLYNLHEVGTLLVATERLSTGCLNAWFDGSARCVAIGEIVFGEQNLTSSEEVRFLIHQGEDPHPFLNGKDFRQKCILYPFLPLNFKSYYFKITSRIHDNARYPLY